MGRSQPQNACSPPSRAMRSSPGLTWRWYVLARTISAPRSPTASKVRALIAPRVPTGMKAGVATVPWGKCSRPGHRSRIPMKRLRVGILYGGRSAEHEVSVASAAAVFANLDRRRYEPVAVRIEKDGRWVLADRPPLAASASEVIEQSRAEAGR